MPQTITEKVVQAHAVGLPPDAEVLAGDMVTVRPAHVMTHDNTGAVLPKFRAIGATRVADPSQPVFTLDHNVQDTGEENLAKYRRIEEFAADQGITFFPAGAGIGHQLMVEQGFVHPGTLVVASDSHSNMYGALAAVGTLGLVHLQRSNFTPFNASGTSTVSAVTATAALTLWAFLGLESATVPAGDVERPDWTIPRATVLGTLLAGAVYVLGTVAVMGVIPPATLATSTSPFADAASIMWGPWAANAIAAGAAISCFGALNGWILLQGQVPMAAAADGLLPRTFGRLSPRGTPVSGLVISSALVTVIVAMNYTKGLVSAFTFIILLATLATLVPYAFSSLALARMQWAERGHVPARQLIGALAVTLLALAYSIWAIVGSGGDAILWGSLLLLAGVPVYAGMRRGRA